MRPTCWPGPAGKGVQQASWARRNDVSHLALIRDWSGRPLRETQPANADT
jgi:hypothetical protein